MRANNFTLEKQTVPARYPEVFSSYLELFEQEEISLRRFERKFRMLCRAIRADLSVRHGDLENPASAGSGGRLSKEEDALRNEFRRNVYALMRELVGLKWWRLVEPLVQRKTPGKRPRSPFAKKFSDLLHYILRDAKTGELTVFDSAAIGDIANQLAYAQRHDVPYQFLIGFLRDVGFDQAAEKERSDAWEAWHPRSL